MDAELKRLVELAEAEDAFVAAKAKGGKRGQKAYDEAKARFSKLRYEFRLRREAAQKGHLPEGQAAAQPVAAKAKKG